jgi:uncharacterized DUF497 family protein
MNYAYDPAKDVANQSKHGQSKHGLSLAMFAGFDDDPAIVVDDRIDYGETRYRAFGRIDDIGHCLIFTLAGDTMRLISLRRARDKEMARHGYPPTSGDR